MKTTSRLAFLLAVGALALAGCGGGGSGNEVDNSAIEELVAELNRANAQRDGAAVCELLQPSTFSVAFSSRAKCASETGVRVADTTMVSSLTVSPDAEAS